MIVTGVKPPRQSGNGFLCARTGNGISLDRGDRQHHGSFTPMIPTFPYYFMGAGIKKGSEFPIPPHLPICHLTLSFC